MFPRLTCSSPTRAPRVSTDGCSTPPRRPTKRDTSSGWAPTAGAPRYPRCWTRRRWRRGLSPSCPRDSPSEVRDLHRPPLAAVWNRLLYLTLKLLMLEDMGCSGKQSSAWSILVRIPTEDIGTGVELHFLRLADTFIHCDLLIHTHIQTPTAR